MQVLIKPSKIIFVFLFISYIPIFITRIVDIPYYGTFCNSLIFLSCVYFSYYFFRIKDINIYLALICGLFIYLNIVTIIINPKYVADSTIRMGKCVGFVLMLEYLFVKKGARYTISVLMVTMEMFNYINLLFMIIYPNGMYHTEWISGIDKAVKNSAGFVRGDLSRVHWLLGHQSMLSAFTIPSICIAILYAYMLNTKNVHLKKIRIGKSMGFKAPLRSALLIIVCVCETLIANSAGNYIFIAIFFALFLFFRRTYLIKTWQLLIGVVVFYVAGNTLLVNANFFNWLGNILGRTVTLSSRVAIWSNVILGWLNNPIFGCGFINESSRIIRLIFHGFGNPHSDYYWILYEGGIIGIIIFTIILLVVGHQGENTRGRGATCIFASFICFCLMMLDDDYIFRSQFMLIILSCCYHIPMISDELKGSF